jgi:branched-chain amino acid transport system substrate-binding protein
MPNMVHAGTYSAVLSYLKAVEAAGTDETEAVAKKLHELTPDDVFAVNAKVLPNGRMVHDMYLFEAKKPSESEGEWDLFNEIATIPGEQAFLSAEESGCPLVQ